MICFTVTFFHPCHSNPSWMGNSNGFLGDGFFNSTHVSEWCVLGPFTKTGERTLGPSWGKFLWWGGKLNDQLDLTLIIIRVPGPWWVPDTMFYFGKKSEIFFFLVNIQHLQNGEEFVQLSYNNISPRRRWCFPQKMWITNVALTLGCSHGIQHHPGGEDWRLHHGRGNS